MWHFVCIERRPYLVANEKQSGFRVVDNAMNLLWFKFVEDGHCHGAITQCGQKRHRPVGAVASAEGNAVAFLDACVLKHDV